MTVLDASDRVVLSNWQTYRRVQQSIAKIDRWLGDVAEQACKSLVQRFGTAAQSEGPWDSKVNRWFDLDLKALIVNQTAPKSIFTFGIEGMKLETMLTPSKGNEFTAYAFWQAGSTSPLNKKLQPVARIFQQNMPPGFAPSPDKATEYLPVKRLGPLEPSQVLDLPYLTKILAEPLESLMLWYKPTKNKLAAIISDII